jgi:hypothetical protein
MRHVTARASAACSTLCVYGGVAAPGSSVSLAAEQQHFSSHVRLLQHACMRAACTGHAQAPAYISLAACRSDSVRTGSFKRALASVKVASYGHTTRSSTSMQRASSNDACDCVRHARVIEGR